MQTDSLSTWESKGSGLFLKIVSGEPVTLRVLTLDPLVSKDKWGSTKYSLVVWNWNESKPQIWSTTAGVLGQLTAIHRDEDLDPLNKLDVKVSATGEMLEKRYTVMPMPKAKDLTPDMLKEAQGVDLETAISDNMGRLSEFDRSERNKSDTVTEPTEPVNVTDEELDQPIDLNNIPF